MTGLPYLIGVGLLAGGALCMLLGLVLLLHQIHRARRPSVPELMIEHAAQAGDPRSTDSDATTVLPLIRPLVRPPGTLFAPHEGPLTPDPTTEDTTPGENDHA